MTNTLSAQTLTITTSQHAYPIVITHSDTAFEGFLLAPYIVGKQVLIVSNETVAPLYCKPLLAQLEGFDVHTCILPDGELYKNQENLNAIYDALLNARFGRDCTLIALGGGVIGDMTGFAAASFMRGVNFIQIPTTLLSQVDSSVGGKTGINHPLGKNMIGAFWQPVCVLSDMATFQTLPAREFAAGMAEVIKYGLIMDKDFLVWLGRHAEGINAKNQTVLAQMVYRSCQYKAQIVSADEKESGIRALLNLGHTFGHVIETHMGYGNWLHGEAVAAGIMQAASLSCLMGFISRDEVYAMAHLFERFHLPTKSPVIDVDTALSLMGHDKKVKAGKLHFVLLAEIGQAILTSEVEHEFLCRVLTTCYDEIFA